MNSKIKNIIIFSVIALALVLVYIFFIKKSPEETALVTSDNSSFSDSSSLLVDNDESIEPGEGFLSLLLSVKSIKLDDAIFSNLAFSSLEDSSIVLTQDGNEGRPNPFAPIGYESLSFTTTSTEVPTTVDTTVPN